MGKLSNMVPIVFEWDEQGKPIRERKLCYTLKSLMLFEDKYNKSIAEIFEAERDEQGNIILDENGEPRVASFKFEMLAYLVYVGLIKDDSDLTPDEVAEFIDMPDIPYVLSKVLEAIGASNETVFPIPPQRVKGKPLKK